MVLCLPAMAADCVGLKKNPAVYINVPDWEKKVVQPRVPMDLWHGNVLATLVDNYDLVVDVVPVENGACVSLKTVNAIVGYNDFNVQIDIRHTPDTCTYNAILKHEDKHIKTYLSVIDDFKADLQKTIYRAADSVMPIFIHDITQVDDAVDMMNEELQSHPEMILIKQKIRAAQEIKNKQVDEQENKDELKKCLL